MSAFQNIIIKERNKRNLSLEEASKLLSFSLDTLKDLEEGKREATASELVELSCVYNISYNKLLKQPKQRHKHVYKVRKRQLIGFNRYGLKQGWSVIAVPIMAFISICMLFVPGFFVPGSGVVSLIKIMFSANNIGFMALGGIMICVLAYMIIYWTSVLAHGNYARAKMKFVNNVMLGLFAGIVLILTVICIMSFKIKITVGGVFSYIVFFATALTQLILLIVMNLEGGEDGRDQIYIFHETDLSGYETKHWYTLGVVAFSIISFCLLFTVVVYDAKVGWAEINKTMFEMLFGNSGFLGMFIGGLCFACLVFNIIYWLIICILNRAQRKSSGRANNVLMVIVNIILFISTVAMMSYFGFEYFTTGGVLLYVSLFITPIYAMITIPVINCNHKSLYVEDKNGLHKIRAVQGQRPGKIMAYKFPVLLQYFMLILLAVSVGISFLDASLIYVAFISGAGFLFEVVYLILQHNSRYINISIFVYGIVINTIMALFNIFLLGVSVFGTLNLGARIALPIVSGATVIIYACIVFFIKPIRDSSKQL